MPTPSLHVEHPSDRFLRRQEVIKIVDDTVTIIATIMMVTQIGMIIQHPLHKWTVPCHKILPLYPPSKLIIVLTRVDIRWHQGHQH